MRLSNLDSPTTMLGALVVLATAGSFLVPWEWFLVINPANTEIGSLRKNQTQLEGALSETQKELYEAEQVVLLTESHVDEYQYALMQLVQRQVSISDVFDPFDEGPPITNIINDIQNESRIAPASSASELSDRKDMAASYLMEQISKVRGHLADYANQQEAIAAVLDDHDDALEELTAHQFKFDRLDIQIASIEEEIHVITSRLHDITRQSTNQYLAMRAVALGALGAFAAALAAFLREAPLDTRLPLRRTMLSMVFGGIVALVVFALFTTRELSVFVNDGATPDEIPDYWRVVILCLIAGAFADRLFAAARERVEQVTRGQGKASDIPASPS